MKSLEHVPYLSAYVAVIHCEEALYQVYSPLPFYLFNASLMTISGGRTQQLDIFCGVTGFASDFLSFIVVELIWFFHGATQLTKMQFRTYC